MAKYFKIDYNDGIIYYDAPDFMDKKYLRNYATNTRIRPRIKFLGDYYGYDNITIIESDDFIETKKFPTQIRVNSIRKLEVISYNIITKEVEVVTDERKKTYVNRYCLDGLELYFTKDLYYNNATTKEKIKRVYDNFIKEFLRKKENLTYSEITVNLDEMNIPYLTVKLTKN